MFIIVDDPHGVTSGQNTLLKVIEEQDTGRDVQYWDCIIDGDQQNQCKSQCTYVSEVFLIGYNTLLIYSIEYQCQAS